MLCVLADLFRLKIDIELSQLGFLLLIDSKRIEFFLIHQSILKHNGRHDFREKRVAFFYSMCSKRELIDVTDSVQLIRGSKHKNTVVMIMIKIFTFDT